MHKDTVIRPFGDRILLKEVKLEDLPRDTGLVLPDSAKPPESIFEIVAVGPDAEFAVLGNHIIIGSLETGIRPVGVMLGDEKHILIMEDHILAFVDC